RTFPTPAIFFPWPAAPVKMTTAHDKPCRFPPSGRETSMIRAFHYLVLLPLLVGWLSDLLGATGFAHDLWLIPEEKVSTGKPSTIRAHSGMDFPKSEHAPDPAAFKRRVLIRPNGKEGELKAAGKKDLSGLLQFEPAEEGIYVLGVETQPKLITL